jgi:hypothetical protein
MHALYQNRRNDRIKTWTLDTWNMVVRDSNLGIVIVQTRDSLDIGRVQTGSYNT